MKRKSQRNEILIKKLEKRLENNNFDYSKISYENRAIIRHKWNKLYEISVKSYSKTLSKKFSNFWDIAGDFNPQFCFITGRYIPKREKNVKAVKPFKNSKWCYKEDYDRYINHNHISEIVNEDSIIICIACNPKEITDKIPRPRIKNTMGEIINHISKNRKDFDEKDIPENLWDIDLKLIKYKYFLKPMGKRFPKPKTAN